MSRSVLHLRVYSIFLLAKAEGGRQQGGGGGGVGIGAMIHRHVDRVRQYYEDYYAQHEGEENVPLPPPPPPADLRRERMRELLGGVG